MSLKIRFMQSVPVFSLSQGPKAVVKKCAHQVNPDVSLAEFYVVGYRQRRVLEELTSGNYSRLCADILFSRSTGYYIIQVLHSRNTFTHSDAELSPMFILLHGLVEIYERQPRRFTCRAA